MQIGEKYGRLTCVSPRIPGSKGGDNLWFSLGELTILGVPEGVDNLGFSSGELTISGFPHGELAIFGFPQGN